MNLMYKTIISILILAIVIVSCKKEDLNEFNQPVLFEYEYINHAWLYTHKGWMMDEEGNVRGFKLPEEWNNPDEKGYITKQELVDNLEQADTLYTTVDESDLLNHFNNRFDMQGAITDTSDVIMADAGIGTLYVYVWDEEVEKYEKVLLASKGDLSVTNMNSSAKSAVSWLVDIGKQTDRFFWFDQ